MFPVSYVFVGKCVINTEVPYIVSYIILYEYLYYDSFPCTDRDFLIEETCNFKMEV